MKTILALVTSIFLFGCAGNQVIVETKHVTSTIPSDHLDIPNQPTPIDVSVATQKDLAEWMLRSEERTVILENNLKAIKKLQEDFKKLVDTQPSSLFEKEFEH